MSDTYTISRADLAPIFGNNPRVLAQFEALQRKVVEHEGTIGVNLAATTALADATFVTLSGNAELANEYVLQVGEGLSLDASAGVLRLTMQAPVVSGGFRVRMVAAGDTTLALPVSGVVATREWFNAMAPGPYADDTAAATAGVAVGEVYRKGTKLAARMA